MDVAGKVALVTGGAHRVGGAITRMLVQHGARVAFTHHRAATAAAELITELRGAGGDLLSLPCDVGDWTAVRVLAQRVQQHFGSVDIVVNSASLFLPTPFPATEVERWRQVTRVTLDGAYYVCNAFVPLMQERDGGVIVNVLDSGLWKPIPGFLGHTAAKGGLAALTRQLAVDLAPTIRVNGVAPGPVLPPDRLPAERRALIADGTLLKRWGRPEDVAQAVLYLVKADFVTGEILAVDGGERLARH